MALLYRQRTGQDKVSIPLRWQIDKVSNLRIDEAVEG